jgi:hypothetical protein
MGVHSAECALSLISDLYYFRNGFLYGVLRSLFDIAIGGMLQRMEDGGWIKIGLVKMLRVCREPMFWMGPD